MNRLGIDMPVVGECSVAECAYNVSQSCHARAITVGDNDDYECTAQQIAVGHAGQAGHSASCLTYQQRLLPNKDGDHDRPQS